FDCAITLIELLAIKGRVGPVFCADAIYVTSGTWAQAEILAASPVIYIMSASVGWNVRLCRAVPTRKVRNLVLSETVTGSRLKQRVVHLAGDIFVQCKFPGLQLREERSVVFVYHFVTREVFTAECERVGECRAPNVRGLPGNSEHEVDIDILESAAAQNIEGLENLRAAVNPSQSLQHRIVQRLHAHRNAVHAVVTPQLAFVQRDGGGIALNRPF